MSFPICVRCKDPFKYKGPNPRLLPCLHSVCAICLDTPVKSVTCTVCDRRHSVTGNPFPEDQVILDEVLHLTVKHRPREITCTHRDDDNQAVCWCENCSEFLCKHCRKNHKDAKGDQDHIFHQLSDLTVKLKESQLLCNSHDLPKTLYDKDCDYFICRKCFEGKHKGHNTQPSSEFGKMVENDLKASLKSISDKKIEIQEAMSGADVQADMIDKKSASLREAVEQTFSELRSFVDKRERVVQQELDRKTAYLRKSNKNRITDLETMTSDCQSALDYINKCLLYSSPEHLFTMKSSVGEATRLCVSEQIPKANKYASSLEFSKQGYKDIEDFVTTFGSFVTCCSTRGSPDEPSSFQSVKGNTVETLMESNLKENLENLRSSEEKIRDLESSTSKQEKMLLELKKNEKVDFSEDEEKIRDLESRNSQLEKMLQELKKNEKVDLSEGEEKIRDLESRNSQLEKMLQELKKNEKVDLSEDEEKIRDLESRNSQLEKTLQELKQDGKVDTSLSEEKFRALERRNTKLEKLLLDIDQDGFPDRSCLRILTSSKNFHVVKMHAMTLDGERTNPGCCVRNGRFLEHDRQTGVVGPNGLMTNRKYSGTSTTSPLSRWGNVYWEVEAEVGVERMRSSVDECQLVLHMVICDEATRDTKGVNLGMDNTCGLLLVCEPKNKCVFIHVTQDGTFNTARKVKIERKENGYIKTFKIGVLCDRDSNKITFLDCVDMSVLGSGRIPGIVKLWPMFGIHNGGTRQMRLVSGLDVQMDTRKEQLLIGVLESQDK